VRQIYPEMNIIIVKKETERENLATLLRNYGDVLTDRVKLTWRKGFRKDMERKTEYERLDSNAERGKACSTCGHTRFLERFPGSERNWYGKVFTSSRQRKREPRLGVHGKEGL